MQYTFVIEGRLSNLNDYTKACRTNKFIGSKLKKENEEIVSYYILQQLQKVKITLPVKINYDWYESNCKRDLDNIAFAKKFIQDALVKNGVLENDGWKQIKGFQDNFYVDKDNPRIIVTITEIEQ